MLLSESVGSDEEMGGVLSSAMTAFFAASTALVIREAACLTVRCVS